MNGFSRFKPGFRKALAIASVAVLAGCQIVPKTTAPDRPDAPVVSRPAPEPSATALPSDATRHRVALLVPLSGANGAVGQSIANATTMALLDTNADNLRITTYDTAAGARNAASRAIGDGNALILGPLLADNVPSVLAESRAANIPLISFSNDATVASPDAFVMGHIPEESIAATVKFARSRGSANFAALVPNGAYGQRAEAALAAALQTHGGTLVTTERYARGNTSIISAAERIKQRGGYDTVLIAEGARLTARAAATFDANTQLLGTELLSGESSITRTPAMRGLLFSAVPDQRFKRFADSYNSRFGGQPYRISTLGYDSVLLALRVARDWRVGDAFPTSALRDEGGFLGLDGAFRFQRSGVVQRAMEVREVRNGQVVIVGPAPARFED
ncbi:MAG: penicillin-binding protein activator [Alteripontixanthobacter sp.]